MIHTRTLTKDFVVSKTNTVHAVRGISLDVEPGELVAVLGPNGAGKSTTMRMLTTLIAPTAGSATVAGHDVVAESAQVRRLIGYVGQGNGAGHNQRVGDELTSQGLIYGLDRRSAKRRTAELLEALDLADSASARFPACRVGNAVGWTWPWVWCIRHRCCSWTSRRPDLIRRTGRTCGNTSCRCGRTPAAR